MTLWSTCTGQCRGFRWTFTYERTTTLTSPWRALRKKHIPCTRSSSAAGRTQLLLSVTTERNQTRWVLHSNHNNYCRTYFSRFLHIRPKNKHTLQDNRRCQVQALPVVCAFIPLSLSLFGGFTLYYLVRSCQLVIRNLRYTTSTSPYIWTYSCRRLRITLTWFVIGEILHGHKKMAVKTPISRLKTVNYECLRRPQILNISAIYLSSFK